MISEKNLMRAVARFRLTKYFPGSDSEILTALAVEFRKLCADDAELDALTDAAIEAGEGEWPGIGAIQNTAETLKRKRQAKADRANAFRSRDEHERTCAGRRENGRPCDAEWMEDVWIGMGSGWSREVICRCRIAERMAASDLAQR